MPFVLPDLPFEPTALEPHLSAETFEFHHGKHHKAYVDKTNELVAGTPHAGHGLVELIRAAKGTGPLFNQSAQIWNHSFYWLCLAPQGGRPTGTLAQRIDDELGGYDAFAQAFVKEGVGHFASGWAWLVEDNGRLKITSYHDADTPVAYEGVKPLLTLDVWEHAYYVDYRNLRQKYLESLLSTCVNWDFVAQNLDGEGASRADQPGDRASNVGGDQLETLA